MSRISKYNVYKCPACDQLYKQPLYASINFMVGILYSDGHFQAPLYVRYENIISPCSCGAGVELTSKNQLGFTHRPEISLPSTRPSNAKTGFLERFQKVFSRRTSHDTAPQQVATAEDPESWWFAPTVELASAEMLVNLLSSDLGRFKLSHSDELVEWRIRSRLREMFNRPYRIRECRYPAVQDERTLAYRKENLSALADIIEVSSVQALVQKIEIYRELGDVEKASNLFAAIDPTVYGFDTEYLCSLFQEDRLSVSERRLLQLSVRIKDRSSDVYVVEDVT